MAIAYEVRDRIAWIGFCRPEKHNAFRDEDLADFVDALGRLDGDDDVDLGIVYGEGRSFSSGADVGDRLTRSLEEGSAEGRVSEVQAILGPLNWKPLIAAVHGYCMGHAMVTALTCDHVVADTTARFQVTETAIGVPSPGLWMQLGEGRFATEVSMTGRFFTAEEAHREGVVTRLVEEGTHRAAAEELARAILESPQSVVRYLVRTRRTLLGRRLEEVREVAGEFDWLASAESAERIRRRSETVSRRHSS